MIVCPGRRFAGALQVRVTLSFGAVVVVGLVVDGRVVVVDVAVVVVVVVGGGLLPQGRTLTPYDVMTRTAPRASTEKPSDNLTLPMRIPSGRLGSRGRSVKMSPRIKMI